MIAHALTVDVEEWFHVLNLRRLAPEEAWDRLERRAAQATRVLLDLLDRHGVRATFFCLGWLAEREPGLIGEIAAAGHEVASHGYGHRLLGELTATGLAADLDRSAAILEGITGRRPEGFRACTFSITPRNRWALPVLAAAGIRFDSSVFPVLHPDYGWPGFPPEGARVLTAAGAFVEIPPLTVRLLGRSWPAGGGGYLRLLPAGLISAVLARWERRGVPGCLYLHPWELDPGQPRLAPGGLRGFRHYLNLKRTAGKLERLLRRHPFGPLGALAAARSAMLPEIRLEG